LAWSESRGSRLALTYIRQMNGVNYRNDFCHDDSSLKIVPGIIIIIIIIIIIRAVRESCLVFSRASASSSAD